MSCSVPRFWQFSQESGLLSAPRCKELADQWQSMKGAARTSSARTLAEWLVAEKAITRYQAKLLLAGQPGPFHYGDYLVAKRLIRGGLVDCFQAVHVPTQFPVTLRFVRGASFELNTQVDDVRELLEAARAVRGPDDRACWPQVVPFYEWVDCGAYQFGVFGRVEGEPVSDTLAESRRLDIATVCRIVAQAAVAISPLHEGGRAHGGLQPQTVWIEWPRRGSRPGPTAELSEKDSTRYQRAGESPHPVPRVRVLPRELSESWRTLQGGTPWLDAASDVRALRAAEYTAPEAAGRFARRTPVADVYSLGCILYALLAGHPPFRGESVAEILQQHATEAVPPLSPQAGRRWDPSQADCLRSGPENVSLDGLLAEMLSKDPDKRPAAGRAVADALAAIVGHEVTRTSFDETPPQREEAYLLQLAERNRAAAEANPWKELPLAEPIPADANVAAEAPAASPLAGVNPRVPVALPANGDESPVELSTRLTRRRVTDGKLLVAGLVSAAMAAGGVFVWNVLQRETFFPPALRAAANAKGIVEKPPEGNVSRVPDGPPGQVSEWQVADDGQSLWASPTTGAPLSAHYLPEGTQGILAVRLSALLAHSEGERIVAAAGPYVQSLIRTLPTATGFDAAEIEQLILGWRMKAPADSSDDASRNGITDQVGVGAPPYDVGIVLRVSQGVSLAELAERLAGAEEARAQGQGILVRDQEAFYLPAAEFGRVVVIAPASEVSLMLQRTGPTPLRREIEQLLAASDADRHVTLLAPPSLLLGDGRGILLHHAATIREPLQELLGQETRGLLVSAHWGNDFFLELSAVAAVDTPPLQLRAFLDERLQELPRRVEDHVLSLSAHPYGRRVVGRLPEMIRRLVTYTRSAAEPDRVVFRTYLPIAAGHNLLMAGEIALAESQLAGMNRPDSAKGLPRSVQDRLVARTSLSFPRDTLETALNTLASDVGVPIVILGNDLQLEGITKNQSFSIELRDRRAREILVEILRLANPDKTAAGPDDPRQKLIYVIGPDAAGIETIRVTTRQAAEQRGDDLPAEFRVDE